MTSETLLVSSSGFLLTSLQKIAKHNTTVIYASAYVRFQVQTNCWKYFLVHIICMNKQVTKNKACSKKLEHTYNRTIIVLIEIIFLVSQLILRLDKF